MQARLDVLDRSQVSRSAHRLLDRGELRLLGRSFRLRNRKRAVGLDQEGGELVRYLDDAIGIWHEHLAAVADWPTDLDFLRHAIPRNRRADPKAGPWLINRQNPAQPAAMLVIIPMANGA